MGKKTVEDAKRRLQLAREALIAVGGKIPKKTEFADAELSCEGLYQGAAVLTWFAAQAALVGEDYQPYLLLADQWETAAVAQGC